MLFTAAYQDRHSSSDGFDAVLAARHVGPGGWVIGVDMPPAMLEKARTNFQRMALENVELRQGCMEELPVADTPADVVISNGVLDLSPDNVAVVRQIARVPKPGKRIQIADIVVSKAVPDAAKENLDLWTG